MWTMSVPVVGQCRDCGEDIEVALRVRATSAWLGRYEGEDRLRRRVNRALVRAAVERHERRCTGRLRPRMSYPVSA
jgi:hypothetical protein